MKTQSISIAALLLLAAPLPANALTIFVTNEKDNTVTVLDETLKVIKTIETGLRPRGIRITPDYKEVLICIGDDNRLDVIDTEKLEVSRTLDSGPDPELLDVDPEGKLIYIANEDEGWHHGDGACELEARRRRIVDVDIAQRRGHAGTRGSVGRRHVAAEDGAVAAARSFEGDQLDARRCVAARGDLSTMLFGTGLPFGGRRGLPEMLAELTRMMPRTAGIRRWGTASLDLAYVAAGRFDGFWERGLSPWDIGAGIVLVREAGGLVGTIGESSEAQDPMPSGDILAANPGAYAQLARLLAPATRTPRTSETR